jgi:hypothetical protein
VNPPSLTSSEPSPPPQRARKGRTLALVLALTLAGAAVAGAVVVQQEGLRAFVLAQIQPSKLPRHTPAPIAVFVAGHIETTTGVTPPQLQRMTVKVNRHGLLQAKGLPSCPFARVRATSTQRALSLCSDALVGSGRFWATIVLPDQRPYPTRGRLLIFNGERGGARVLFAHIYTTKPFATSFVITFAIRHINDGPYGTQLSASLPQALGTWGFVDRIKLTLRRRYTYRGQRLSYFNAACPAAKGSRLAVFPLALASFYFAERKPISVRVDKRCRTAPEAAGR